MYWTNQAFVYCITVKLLENNRMLFMTRNISEKTLMHFKIFILNTIVCNVLIKLNVIHK